MEEMDGDEKEIREGADLVMTTQGYFCIQSCPVLLSSTPFILLHSIFISGWGEV